MLFPGYFSYANSHVGIKFSYVVLDVLRNVGPIASRAEGRGGSATLADVETRSRALKRSEQTISPAAVDRRRGIAREEECRGLGAVSCRAS